MIARLSEATGAALVGIPMEKKSVVTAQYLQSIHLQVAKLLTCNNGK